MRWSSATRLLEHCFWSRAGTGVRVTHSSLLMSSFAGGKRTMEVLQGQLAFLQFFAFRHRNLYRLLTKP